MNILHQINGAMVSATDVRKSWTKIVQGVKDSHKPVFVFINNKSEAVVLSDEDFQAMQLELEMARREEFGRQMVADLLEYLHLKITRFHKCEQMLMVFSMKWKVNRHVCR